MRPVADIRVGIMTIREKWETRLKTKTSTLTEPYLSEKFPIIKEDNNVLINGSICPNEELVMIIKNLKPSQAVLHRDAIVALHVTADELDKISDPPIEGIEEIILQEAPVKINYPWEIFTRNGQAIQDDFELLSRNRKSQKLSTTNRILGEENIFVEKGAIAEHAILNATTGPIYLGKDSEIMEGAVIRGPFALCDHSTVKMAAKIYGPTTAGPYCKLGGEVNNSVFFAYSNKAHDGFVGHSVIAEWCNLGADTNTSNLRNTYDSVKLWNYRKQTFVDTCQQFCGLIMGDHSKSGINTMFNTGTMVGVNVNIFGPGFQRNFIPSFTWGGTTGHSNYDLKKALEVAERVYQRRGLRFDEVDKALLADVYHITMVYKRL